jgi:hypothetical protein
MKMLLHEFYSDEDCSRGRKSCVFKEPDGSYTIVLIQDGAIVEELNLLGHSEQYAEDTAEDWVIGARR